MRDALVICYHGVSSDWPSPLAIRPEQLEKQVTEFLARGYRPVTFTEAATGTSSERVLAVTFDDAYRSVIDLALPVLADLGVLATVFAPTDFVGQSHPTGWHGIEEWVDGQWADEIHVMDWPDLERLAAAGWEIGSHTRSHARLPALTEIELLEELSGSRAEIETRMNVPCTAVAYPYGATDRAVARAARAAGYLAGGGLLPDRLRRRDPWLFPRVFAGSRTRHSALLRRSRPMWRALQGSAAWPLLAWLRDLG